VPLFLLHRGQRRAGLAAILGGGCDQRHRWSGCAGSAHSASPIRSSNHGANVVVGDRRVEVFEQAALHVVDLLDVAALVLLEQRLELHPLAEARGEVDPDERRDRRRHHVFRQVAGAALPHAHDRERAATGEHGQHHAHGGQGDGQSAPGLRRRRLVERPDRQ
jgi:hypothetical protein